MPETFAPSTLPGDRLTPTFADAGHPSIPHADPDMAYTTFNMRDPIVGGYTPEKVALRRAMSLAYDIDQEIKLVRNGTAVAVQMPIPFGVLGYDPSFNSGNRTIR